MSRSAQTKAMGFKEGKWLYTKSAGDIKRAQETKALKEYITANIEKIKDGATVATDENVELQEFNCDLHSFMNATKHLDNGLSLVTEKIKRELYTEKD